MLTVWTYDWVPNGPRGYVRDLRLRWACEEAQLAYEVRSVSFYKRGPEGFLGTRRLHVAYEALDFVPPDRPRVALDGAPWVSLPDPGVGRRRASREGRALATASGPAGEGYAICIACGWAEAESGGEDAALPSGMRDHFPLQRLRDNHRQDRRCPGNDPSSRQIRRHVRLGQELVTDAFELQLDAIPPTSEGQARALVVAAALREAVARRLGVDAAQEMGVAVAPRQRGDGGRRMSLFLFDRASGGSGFSVTAEVELPGFLREAAAVFACPANCENGCPDCILRPDLQHERASLDRPGALSLLRDEV